MESKEFLAALLYAVAVWCVFFAAIWLAAIVSNP